MSRPITLLGAASSIGIKPYEDGTARWLDRAPAALRHRRLADRLGAADAGDLAPPPYRDFVRPPGAVRNEREVESYSLELAERVQAVIAQGAFALVLGGDCSIVLGCCLGARRAAGGPIGIAYVDAHADFATPAESFTGSAASMCFALALGRGNTPLARLAGDAPLVLGSDAALIGRRDDAEPYYGQHALEPAGVLDLTAERLAGALAAAAPQVLERVARPDLAGFWIHVDTDVLDESVMPAVDSPSPGGAGLDELARLVAPLARHPRALGMELTIYDPRLDPDGECASRLVDLLTAIWSERPAEAPGDSR